MRIRNNLWFAAIVMMIAGGYSAQASAGILLSLTDGTNTISANDSATPGLVTFSGSIGNFVVSMDTGVGYPLSGSPTASLIDLSSLDVTSNVGGTLTLSLTETGFAAKPGPAWFASSLTGNYFNSHATLSSYLDTTNAPFGTGTLLASGLLDNQASAVFEPPIGSPYSLTEIVTVTAGAHSMTSLDAMVVDAPEPPSISLLGAALLGFGLIGARLRPRRLAATRA